MNVLHCAAEDDYAYGLQNNPEMTLIYFPDVQQGRFALTIAHA